MLFSFYMLTLLASLGHGFIVVPRRADFLTGKHLSKTTSLWMLTDLESPIHNATSHERVLWSTIGTEVKSQRMEILEMSEGEVLQEMFLNQISGMGMSTSNCNKCKSSEETENFDSKFRSVSLKKWLRGDAQAIETKLIETPTLIKRGMLVEFIDRQKLCFGNLQGWKMNPNGLVSSLLMNKSTGEVIPVDVSQIISIWDDVIEEDAPNAPQEWALVTENAIEILENISPRKLDLEEFWRLVSQRSSSLSIDSLDLSIYIFQERKFRSWLDPFHASKDVDIRIPSVAQRYAASILLFTNDFHFKRKPSLLVNVHCNSEETACAHDITLQLNEHVGVLEGGYKVLDSGHNLFREGEIFAKYFEDCKRNCNNAESDLQSRASCINRQLRALEVYSMSPNNASPPMSVRHLLKKFKKKKSPCGAAEILRELNHASLSSGNSKNELSLTVVHPGITAWSNEELEDARRLSDEMISMRVELSKVKPVRDGKKSPIGRMDYRASSKRNPIICIDNKRASFFDDAFSISPETDEILVHVVDVMEHLRKYDTLSATAKERVSSLFLPSGSAHMLPFMALEALKLSSEGPNEVITVALSIGTEGEIIGYRIFPSIIGPVFPISIEIADQMLSGNGVEKDEDLGKLVSLKPGYPDAVVNDLVFCSNLIQKVIKKNPWVDAHFSEGKNREFSLNKRDGTHTERFVKKTVGNRMINALLTMYSNSTCEFTQAKGLNVPIAWENRDRRETSLIRRFGTQPLRNWVSQMQQKQIRAAMKMEISLNRRDCAMIIMHHNAKRKFLSSLEENGRKATIRSAS